MGNDQGRMIGDDFAAGEGLYSQSRLPGGSNDAGADRRFGAVPRPFQPPEPCRTVTEPSRASVRTAAEPGERPWEGIDPHLWEGHGHPGPVPPSPPCARRAESERSQPTTDGAETQRTQPFPGHASTPVATRIEPSHEQAMCAREHAERLRSEIWHSCALDRAIDAEARCGKLEERVEAQQAEMEKMQQAHAAELARLHRSLAAAKHREEAEQLAAAQLRAARCAEASQLEHRLQSARTQAEASGLRDQLQQAHLRAAADQELLAAYRREADALAAALAAARRAGAQDEREAGARPRRLTEEIEAMLPNLDAPAPAVPKAPPNASAARRRAR